MYYIVMAFNTTFNNISAMCQFYWWSLDLQLPIQSVLITTKVVSLNPTHGMVYSIQHYMIKFISDFRQVSGFLPSHDTYKLYQIMLYQFYLFLQFSDRILDLYWWFGMY
jgi:hypothetical protein